MTYRSIRWTASLQSGRTKLTLLDTDNLNNANPIQKEEVLLQRRKYILYVTILLQHQLGLNGVQHQSALFVCVCGVIIESS